MLWVSLKWMDAKDLLALYGDLQDTPQAVCRDSSEKPQDASILSGADVLQRFRALVQGSYVRCSACGGTSGGQLSRKCVNRNPLPYIDSEIGHGAKSHLGLPIGLRTCLDCTIFFKR